MARTSRTNFVRLQGFQDADASTCSDRYPGLMFQPRVIGFVLVVGLVLQSWLFWALLGTVLWWSAALPELNPFRAAYNALLAGSPDRGKLPPAPEPRRFAQGTAGALMLAIAAALLADWRIVAWSVEAFLVLAVSALVFGDFCLGSFLYLHLRGEGRFARRNLPWASGD